MQSRVNKDYTCKCDWGLSGIIKKCRCNKGCLCDSLSSSWLYVCTEIWNQTSFFFGFLYFIVCPKLFCTVLSPAPFIKTRQPSQRTIHPPPPSSYHFPLFSPVFLESFRFWVFFSLPSWKGKMIHPLFFSSQNNAGGGWGRRREDKMRRRKRQGKKKYGGKGAVGC